MAGDTSPSSATNRITRTNTTKKKAPSFCDDQKAVILNIGRSTNKRSAVLLKSFACLYSPVLDKAFNSPLNKDEDRVQTFELEDFDDLFVLSSLQTWIYMQKLEGPEKTALSMWKLFALWILADKLAMARLQNAIVNKIARGTAFSYLGNDYLIQQSQWVYENTTPDSKFRRLYVDMVAWKSKESNFKEPFEKDKLSKELLFGVVMVHKTFFTSLSQSYRHGRKPLEFQMPKISASNYEVSEK